MAGFFDNAYFNPYGGSGRQGILDQLLALKQQTGANAGLPFSMGGSPAFLPLSPQQQLQAEDTSRAERVMPPAAQPTAGQMPPTAMPTQEQSPGIGDFLKGIGGALRDNSNYFGGLGAGLLQGSLGKGMELATRYGQLDVKQGNQQQVYGTMFNLLRSRGMDPQQAHAIASAASVNPEILKQVAPTVLESPWKFTEKAGLDKYGNPTPGFYNTSNQQIRPASGGMPGAPGGANMGNPDLTGQPYLDTLDPTDRSRVVAATEGRSSPPGGMALKSPMVQRQIDMLAQYEPGFDMTKWAARAATRKEFSAGGQSSPAAQITAGNTAIQHIGHLSDYAEALNNFDIGLPGNDLLNAGRNALKRSSGTSEAQKNFNATRDKYVEEATKFYRGTGGNEADLQRDIKNLDTAASPGELRSAIATHVDLMKSKINALQQRWTQTMGPGAGEFPIIQPETQQALDRIAKRAGGGTASSGGGAGNVIQWTRDANGNPVPVR
jgi:hypothetical protein